MAGRLCSKQRTLQWFIESVVSQSSMHASMWQVVGDNVPLAMRTCIPLPRGQVMIKVGDAYIQHERNGTDVGRVDQSSSSNLRSNLTILRIPRPHALHQHPTYPPFPPHRHHHHELLSPPHPPSSPDSYSCPHPTSTLNPLLRPEDE